MLRFEERRRNKRLYSRNELLRAEPRLGARRPLYTGTQPKARQARQARQERQARQDQNGNKNRNQHSPLLARNTPRDPLHPRCTTNKNGSPARDNHGQRQEMTGINRQRQATASNDRQRQATASNDRQPGTTTDNALPVHLLPAFRRGGPVPDVPQHGNVRQLLQVLDAVGFQGDVPVPDFYSGQAGDGGLAG